MLPLLLLLHKDLKSALSLHEWVVLIASFFVLLALSLSLFLIFTHLTCYTNPQAQKWLIGVVFMVPVYSVESFVSLWNPNISVECGILQNCYEAFALYSFGNYLIACMGGEEGILDFLEKKAEAAAKRGWDSKKAAIQHPFPLKFLLAPWIYGDEVFKTIKFGIVQYMIMKTFSAELALVLELCNVYGDGEFQWNYGYPYITIAMNFSQMWALYCLVQFYNITYEELKPIKPLPKFLSFKAIVFATWWQGVIIALLCAFNIIPGSLGTSKFQSSLQNFVICIEMAIAAIAHIFVFPVTPFRTICYRFEDIENVVETSAPSKEPFLTLDEVDENEVVAYQRITEADVNVSGTSLRKSVQDLVLSGGETVVQDVKVTVSQAVGPVEKGFTALHEKFHKLTWSSNKDGDAEHVEMGIEEQQVQASYTSLDHHHHTAK